jgi:hypothetical protein
LGSVTFFSLRFYAVIRQKLWIFRPPDSIIPQSGGVLRPEFSKGQQTHRAAGCSM